MIIQTEHRPLKIYALDAEFNTVTLVLPRLSRLLTCYLSLERANPSSASVTRNARLASLYALNRVLRVVEHVLTRMM